MLVTDQHLPIYPIQALFQAQINQRRAKQNLALEVYGQYMDSRVYLLLHTVIELPTRSCIFLKPLMEHFLILQSCLKDNCEYHNAQCLSSPPWEK